MALRLHPPTKVCQSFEQALGGYELLAATHHLSINIKLFLKEFNIILFKKACAECRIQQKVN